MTSPGQIGKETVNFPRPSMNFVPRTLRRSPHSPVIRSPGIGAPPWSGPPTDLELPRVISTYLELSRPKTTFKFFLAGQIGNETVKFCNHALCK